MAVCRKIKTTEADPATLSAITNFSATAIWLAARVFRDRRRQLSHLPQLLKHFHDPDKVKAALAR